MTNKKFKSELDSLDKFFAIFCEDKHSDQKKETKKIKYKEEVYSMETHLCDECRELLNYSIARLQECQHEEKPRCRKCPTPCYDKTEWKKVAKLMRYSGMKLGFKKLKGMFNLKADTK